ncbi:GNAT family N-acetyltransferase [Streptomyces sp. NPDC090025]|uniref:GNAT family N-acetyltransferase n=1 Tax=Streptomyces sp. NPDC090025 TaxID=3365922 RepID=UPI0038375876
MTPNGQLAVKRPADVPLDSLVRLVRSYEEQITGVSTCTRDDVLRETGLPGYEENSWCLTGPGDEVLAWAALTPRGDTIDASLTALPGRHGESAARTLLCLVLDRADELAAERGAPYRLSVGRVLRGDVAVPTVLVEAGFVRGASSGQYDIDLRQPVLPPLLPDDGTLRQAGPDDIETLHALHLRSMTKGPKTVDATAFGTALRRLWADDGVTLLLEIAGRPAGHVLAHASDGEGRILSVAVAPAFRGLGIGLALLTSALAELGARGAERALVTLDSGDLNDDEALGRVLSVQGARVLTRFHRSDA